ncbi:MAG: SNF2-related protein [Actinomycetes bacterium]
MPLRRRRPVTGHAATEEEILAGLRRSVDARTYARGEAYAAQGKVIDLDWIIAGSSLEGSVEGSREEIYDTSAEILVDRQGVPQSIDGSCSCPMRRRCKHVVCLLLTALAHQRLLDHQVPSVSSSGRTAERAPWEALLASAAVPAVIEESTATEGLGLQIDLVVGNTRSRGGATPSLPRLRLVPVRSADGRAWSTRGVTWGTLDGLRRGWQADGDLDAQVLVLKELRALAQINEANAYYRPDDTVWLDAIRSRRVFDLLEEATDLGVVLVTGRNGSGEVTLHRHVAEGLLDVRRVPKGLVVRPAMVAGDLEIDLGSARLLGPIPHGIAWWTEDHATGDVDEVHLARLDGPLDASLLELLRTPRIAIPTEDVDRFLEGYVPDLAERVRVISGDTSVDFPPPRARHLLLSLDPLGSEYLHVAWSWIRPGSRSGQAGSLHRTPGRAVDPEVEMALLAEVTNLLVDQAHLVGPGPELIASTLLSGAPMLEFLTSTLPDLEAIEGVEVENVGTLPGYRAATNAPVITLGGEAAGDWFDLHVTVSVDGEDVPFKDLFIALAEEQEFMVLPSGTFFPLDSDELRQLAALIAEGRALWAGSSGSVRVGRLQTGWWEEVASLGILDAQATAWQDSVADLLSSHDPIPHAVPELIDATLRPYQVDGFRWLAHLHAHGLGGILADDMGLGKTLQALALMVHVSDADPGAAPFLVVAPTSVVGNWAAEAQRFAPGLTVATISEGLARRGVELSSITDNADLVITSYGLFRREFEHYEAVEWSGLFLDEAQFVKNHTSQASRRARMLSTKFKVAVTGTPMENNLLELWSLFAITAPGLLGSTEKFRTHFAMPIEKRQDAERLVELRSRIRPFMLRRNKELVATELPPKTEQILEVELSAKHRKVYDTYLHRERSRVLGLLDDMDTNRFEIFRSLTLLRQASLDVSLVDAAHAAVPSTKLEMLAEMVGDVVAEGHKVLVFSQFTRFLTSATEMIKGLGIEVAYLDGKTKDRQGAIEKFREGDASVFLISLKAGGFGLNLTEADYCILLDPWWNPATEAQAVDRTHRIGQTKNVMVYRLVARDTIEEKVMAMKAKKAALFDDVIDSGELSQGGLSAADIRGLLS